MLDAVAHRVPQHDDIVEHDSVRLQPRQQLAQRRLGIDRSVDDRLPGRCDIGFELVDRAQPEMRQMPAHEGLPVALPLAVAQRVVGWQLVFLKTVVGEDAGKAGMAVSITALTLSQRLNRGVIGQ